MKIPATVVLTGSINSAPAQAPAVVPASPTVDRANGPIQISRAELERRDQEFGMWSLYGPY